MFDNLREDLRRYGQSRSQQLRAILLMPGLWAIIGYRFARWVATSTPQPRPVQKLLNGVATVVNLLVGVLTNIEIPAGAQIGPGLFIAHTGYIVLAPGVQMGRHCTLTQGVTIGHAGGGEKGWQEDCPVIGDRVYIGPGAAIIGPITVGNDALIGVGAVVTRPIPPRGVAVGNPARVISLKGSFDIILYAGSESDPERLAAFTAAASPAPAEQQALTN